MRGRRFFFAVAAATWSAAYAGPFVGGELAGSMRPLSARRAEADAKVPLLLTEHKAAGAAIALIQGGRVAWTGYYGEQRAGVPASPDHGTHPRHRGTSRADDRSEDLIIAKVLAGRPKDLGSDLTPAFDAIRRRD